MLAFAWSSTLAAAPTAPGNIAASSAGPYSASDLYNRANGYARAGKPGLAVLNYERARLLSPADADIDANLRAVLESQHLPGEPESRFDRVLAPAGPIAAALLGLTGLLLIVSAAAAVPWLRARRVVRTAVALLGTAMLAFTLTYGRMQWQGLHAAIVVAGPAPARVSPASMADTLFSLAEGDSVRIAAERQDYVLVQAHSGATGWVARDAVTPIVPAVAGRHDIID